MVPLCRLRLSLVLVPCWLDLCGEVLGSEGLRVGRWLRRAVLVGMAGIISVVADEPCRDWSIYLHEVHRHELQGMFSM